MKNAILKLGKGIFITAATLSATSFIGMSFFLIGVGFSTGQF